MWALGGIVSMTDMSMFQPDPSVEYNNGHLLTYPTVCLETSPTPAHKRLHTSSVPRNWQKRCPWTAVCAATKTEPRSGREHLHCMLVSGSTLRPRTVRTWPWWFRLSRNCDRIDLTVQVFTVHVLRCGICRCSVGKVGERTRAAMLPADLRLSILHWLMPILLQVQMLLSRISDVP